MSPPTHDPSIFVETDLQSDKGGSTLGFRLDIEIMNGINSL